MAQFAPVGDSAIGVPGSKVDTMTRNRILAIGTLLWTAVAVDTIVHVALGEWIAPAMAAIAAAAFIAWRRARRPVPVPA